MKRASSELRRAWRWTWAAVLLASCGGAVGVPQTGGESHFLVHCEGSTCGEGLDCIGNVCTRGCVVDEADCTDLSQGAICTDQSVEPGAVAVCDVACADDADCAAVGSSHRCDAGFCRAVTGTVDPGPGPSGHPLVIQCPPSAITSDPFTDLRHRFNGDLLEIEIGHGGGCEEHSYILCYDPAFLESAPVQTSLTLIHDAHGDSCEAYLQATLTFDLSTLAQHYNDSYQTAGGLIQTNYGLYAFGELSCEERSTAAYSQMLDAADWSSMPCSTDADCTFAFKDVTCAHSCSSPITSANEAVFDESLSLIERAVCGDFAETCPFEPVPPCSPPLPSVCMDGKCAEGGP
jgi:hypothetical protein